MNDPSEGADGKVIHVDFRRGRVESIVRAPPSEQASVTRTFTPNETADLFALPLRTLTRWDKEQIVRPSGVRDGRAVYTFTDLIAVRTAKGLLESGFPRRQIRQAIESLRARMPDLAQPLTDARVSSEGHSLVARTDGALFDPVTGQLNFDFNVQALRDDVVRVLKPRVSPRQAEAYALYLEGLRLDEDETTRGRAEEAYRRAMELDPRLATAMTNLGNLRLLAGDRGEAEALYRRAIEADAQQPEAPYNLAYLLVDQGRRTEAITMFERALGLRPDFAEAHFNLAMALTEAGHFHRAKGHWQRYLELEPRGAWSAMAREHLHPPG